MYTLADAVRLKDHVLERWEAADKDPALVEDGALNVVVVGGGHGDRECRRLAELYHSNFTQDYPGMATTRPGSSSWRPARRSCRCSSPTSAPTRSASSKSVASKCCSARWSPPSSRPCVTLKSGTVLDPHTLVWGAGLRASPVVETLGVELEHGHRLPAQPDLSVAGHPEVFTVGDIAWITDTKTDTVLPQLGSVALQAGEQAGENIGECVEGKASQPFRYDDKGTMALIGPACTAVIQTHGGRMIKGKTAALAWGAVHLALLSTGEDRAKALVDWTWAVFTHERPGRITVKTDED